MRIFLTGATGFIGSHTIPELLAAGHSVLGLTRSDEGAKALVAAGVEPYRGTLEDPASLAAGAAQADAVIHLAFDHNFARMVDNCEKDRRNIKAMGEALAGSDRPLVITSGTGMGTSAPGRAGDRGFHPGRQSQSARRLRTRRARGGGHGRQGRGRAPAAGSRHPQAGPGFALCDDFQAEGVAGYIGDGLNRWPAAHISDVARLYKLAVEQGRAGERFNAVDEEGIAAKDIAAVIGRGLGVPVRSLTPEEAVEHYGWLGHFLAMDMPASSAWTRERLGWRPSGAEPARRPRRNGLQGVRAERHRQRAARLLEPRA